MKVLSVLILTSLVTTFSSSSNAYSRCFVPPQFCQVPPSESVKQTTLDDELALTAILNITPDSESDTTHSLNNKSDLQTNISKSISDKTIINKALEIAEPL